MLGNWSYLVCHGLSSAKEVHGLSLSLSLSLSLNPQSATLQGEPVSARAQLSTARSKRTFEARLLLSHLLCEPRWGCMASRTYMKRGNLCMQVPTCHAIVFLHTYFFLCMLSFCAVMSILAVACITFPIATLLFASFPWLCHSPLPL